MIKAKRHTDVPGDTRMEMLHMHTSLDGRVWMRGTVYQPVSIGRDNAATGTAIQTVSINGKTIDFAVSTR